MLTDDQVAAYRRDGFLVVPGLISGSELADLRAASDRVLAEAVAYGEELDRTRGPIRLHDDHGFTEWEEIDDKLFLYGRGANGERIWRRAEGMWNRDRAFRLVTAHPDLVAISRRLLEDDDIVPAHDSMVVKMPGAGAAVPFHRDPPGPPLIEQFGDASSNFICDIYLDESTTDNGCLWAIPGSHRGDPADVPPLDFDRPDAVPLQAQPGDLVIHSSGVLHGSPANRSRALRRTFYLHYRPRSALLAGEWSHRGTDWIAEGQRKLVEWGHERAAAAAAG